MMSAFAGTSVILKLFLGEVKMKSRKGFTLIELMVVVLIVGILAAVAIPILRGRIDAAKWSEGKAMMGSIATAIRAYAAEKGPNGSNPTSIIGTGVTQLGFATGDLTGTYFVDGDFALTAVDITTTPITFTITCTAGGGADAPSVPAGYTLNQAGTFTAQ
jgi:type IV pilus assembly protein PilA